MLLFASAASVVEVDSGLLQPSSAETDLDGLRTGFVAAEAPSAGAQNAAPLTHNGPNPLPLPLPRGSPCCATPAMCWPRGRHRSLKLLRRPLDALRSGAARAHRYLEVLARRRGQVGARPLRPGKFKVRVRSCLALRVRCVCHPSPRSHSLLTPSPVVFCAGTIR